MISILILKKLSSFSIRNTALKIGVENRYKEFEAINLTRDAFHGEWNYSISAR